mmetsp:Transcript_43241/g.125946  ORF Transcript_43241/g.125946 Transcript_43241/m.125946 type:complete len:214 (-) Transcript_43241:438-1079(-)
MSTGTQSAGRYSRASSKQKSRKLRLWRTSGRSQGRRPGRYRWKAPSRPKMLRKRPPTTRACSRPKRFLPWRPTPAASSTPLHPCMRRAGGSLSGRACSARTIPSRWTSCIARQTCAWKITGSAGCHVGTPSRSPAPSSRQWPRQTQLWLASRWSSWSMCWPRREATSRCAKAGAALSGCGIRSPRATRSYCRAGCPRRMPIASFAAQAPRGSR